MLSKKEESIIKRLYEIECACFEKRNRFSEDTVLHCFDYMARNEKL